MIELRRLHRYFGSFAAVKDVTFEVDRGQVCGFIGPNGAGKTTSMRILSTLDLPTYGDAYVDGFSCVNDPDRVRRRLGFMPDYFGTYPNVNCREYLDFFARSYGLRGSERRTAIERVISFSSMSGMTEKPIRGLSKGMKQRLCLGRAMLHDPAVLILDEPAAGLDPRARIDLRDMIRALAADGKTVLISSHILTELAEVCDRVAIIEKGQLLAFGSVDEIRQRTTVTTTTESTEKIVARVLSDANALGKILSDTEGVEQIVIDGELVRFQHSLGQIGQAKLLKDLIEDGHELCEFGSEVTSLEDVFLAVTRGEVQ
ncbi:MAG TPA: ABC transporter ATP-binding protein [Planctomycetaceae bacterium]|nr:ABC transporter ATP-binding protein [Planctomycetaceae bacterium]